LGHQGIPLWDELKSFLGQLTRPTGETEIFLAHCRGDRELDLGKLAHALGASRIQRLETDSGNGCGYGTVNPFTFSELLQVFDLELQHRVGVPGTVMTNAGSHTRAVEFFPTQLVPTLPHASWADIAAVHDSAKNASAPRGIRNPQTIGILTGNPPVSGSNLFDAIIAHIQKMLKDYSLGDVCMPKIHMVSVPDIGVSMEMDRRTAPLRRALLAGIDELCMTGAKIIVHPAHTTHHFAPEMAARAAERGARFMSMAEVTAAKLQALAAQEVALLGTRYVTDFSLGWSVYAQSLEGITVHTPSDEAWAKIHDLAYEVQQNGVTALCLNWMRDLLREVPSSCKHVVLAMTEFGPVIRQLRSRGKQGKILIDPLDIYAEAIARQHVGWTGQPTFS
jgi:aspartate racemase